MLKNRIIKRIAKIFIILILLILIIFLIGTITCFIYYEVNYKDYVSDIVDSMTDTDFELDEGVKYLYSDGSVMLSYMPYENGKIETPNDITDEIKETLLAAEDVRFYDHNGVDIKSIIRAFINNMRGGSTQGASTITQQLVKLSYLDTKKTYDRKIKEALISIEVEKKYSKDEIMMYYLNRVYFGNGIYGIYDASNFYFSKSYKELTYDEAAVLIAIINSPSNLEPISHSTANLKRRNKILSTLSIDTNITTKLKIDDGYGNAYKYDRETVGAITYVMDLVSKDESLSDDTIIETSIDKDIQLSVESFIDELKDPLQGAIVVIDNKTGRVIAIDGAKTSSETKLFSLNRAFQSPRQTGSSIKPLLDYTPIFDKYDIDTEFMVYDCGGRGIPKNSSGGHRGSITIRKAVTNSVNTIAWRLYSYMQEDSIEPLTYLEKMNFSHLDEKDYKAKAVSIGGFTYGATVLEMAAGYATIANRGTYRTPTAILNTEVEEKRIYSPLATYYMTQCMEDVVKYGTAKRLKPNVPVAAKTGTTNDNKDAWLCGFTRDYTIAIWVGADNNKESYSVKSSGEVLDLFKKTLDILPNSGDDIYTKDEAEYIESRAYTRKDSSELENYFNVLRPHSAPVAVPEVPTVIDPQLQIVDESGNVVAQEAIPDNNPTPAQPEIQVTPQPEVVTP